MNPLPSLRVACRRGLIPAIGAAVVTLVGLAGLLIAITHHGVSFEALLTAVFTAFAVRWTWREWGLRSREQIAEVTDTGVRWWGSEAEMLVRFEDVEKVVHTDAVEFHLKNREVVRSRFPDDAKLFDAIRRRYRGPLWSDSKQVDALPPT